MSPTEKVNDPRKVTIAGGYRNALRYSEWLDDWWVGTSPRNGENASVEGPWEDWVALAHNILEKDREYNYLKESGATFKEPNDE